MRILCVVAGCALVALIGCGGGKKVGEACTATDAIACESAANVLACVGGKWASIPCGGPTGCTDTSTGTFCDLTAAKAGQACPPWAENNTLCQAAPSALLTCGTGTWQTTKTCSSCSSATGAAVCVPGGGGGSDGGFVCSKDTCTGCCLNAQTCITAATASACGTAGAACVDCGSGKKCDESFQCVVLAGCNAANCTDGCCADGQCKRAPLSPTDKACGPLGGSCTDCSVLGLVCNPTLRSCQKTSTGGTADAGDACQGVTTSGECLTSTVVQFCSVSTGAGGSMVKTYACTGSATCQLTGTAASCVAASTGCAPGDARCVAAGIEVCGTDGTWGAATSCSPGTCKAGSLGAYCAPAAATVTLTGTLKYEARLPIIDKQFFSPDWSTTTTAQVAKNVSVWSTTGTGATLEIIDIVSTNDSGQYSVKVAKTPSSTDRINFVAVGGDGLGIRYQLTDPQFASGSYPAGGDVSKPRLWSWSAAVSGLSNGGTTTVTTAQGSGALNLFDGIQASYVKDKALHQATGGKDVVIWFGLNVEWDCGACFLDYPINGISTQLFIGGGSADQAYWGDAVIAHEMGHWAMASYGTSPNEGGAHYTGVKTFPGQAWSEGFATFHSSAVRADAVYYDRQGGGMFWFDLSSRQYFPGASAQMLIGRTTASSGMLQQIDENDVAAMLFNVSTSAPSGLGQIHNALGSQHLNTSPWPSGYTRHTWTVDSQGTKKNIVDTREPSLHLGDLFDALRCDGMAASFVDAAADPTTYYPYKSATPTCRSGFCYGCKSSGGQCMPGTTASACGTGGVDCSVCTTTCSNGVCQ